MAAKSGADYREGYFRLRFFHHIFRLGYPEIWIEEENATEAVQPGVHLMLLHYLLNADGTPVADRWIAFRELAEAEALRGGFNDRAVLPLLQAFGNDIESFHQAAKTLGGEPMSRTGDAAYRFLALPYIPVACILYTADEELPPSINILFDANAHHYLPTEDLFALGGYLSAELVAHGKKNKLLNPYLSQPGKKRGQGLDLIK